MPDLPVLTTGRLLLRPLVPADLDEVAALHSDPMVMRYIDDGRPVPPQVVRERDMTWLTADYGPGAGYWLAVERAVGSAIGWFGLRPVPGQPGDLELGYRLRPASWGRGLATEGARALIAHAFQAAGASQVVATTMAVNSASRRVMEKAGLRWLRTWYGDWPIPIPGAEHGDVDYALTASDWRRRATFTLSSIMATGT